MWFSHEPAKGPQNRSESPGFAGTIRDHPRANSLGFLRLSYIFRDVLRRTNGAQKRTRTSTPLRAPPPEDGASTNSAIWARCRAGRIAVRLGRRARIAMGSGACQQDCPGGGKRGGWGGPALHGRAAVAGAARKLGLAGTGQAARLASVLCGRGAGGVPRAPSRAAGRMPRARGATRPAAWRQGCPIRRAGRARGA